MDSFRVPRHATWSIVAAAILGLAVVSEVNAHEHSNRAADLFAGVSLLAAGCVSVAGHPRRLPGLLLVAAGLTWFGATAQIATLDGLAFAHRGLLVHALVLTSFGESARRTRSVSGAALIVVSLGYVASIGGDRALSTSWASAVGAATIALIALARPRWSYLVPAALGTFLWASVAGVSRMWNWLSPSGRFDVYALGIALTSTAVAMGGQRSRLPRTTDIVRDGGPVGVEIGFRTDGASAFEDIGGTAFVPDGRRSVQIELGNGLGQAIISHYSELLEPATLHPDLVDALRLLATQRTTLRTLARRGTDVEQAQHRLRMVDATVTADLELEVERHVTRRITRAIEVLERNDTDLANEARSALLAVVDELRGLIEGLSPVTLDGGLEAALLDLARRQPIDVHVVADVNVDQTMTSLLYFTAAECTTNAVRHAMATSVTLRLTADGNDILLVVADNGKGTASIVAGGGLDGLGERLGSVGGRLDVCSNPGSGTTVTARAPRTWVPGPNVRASTDDSARSGL